MEKNELYEIKSTHYPARFDAGAVHYGACLPDEHKTDFPDDGRVESEGPDMPTLKKNTLVSVGNSLIQGFEYSGDQGVREAGVTPLTYLEISREAVQNFLRCLPKEVGEPRFGLNDVLYMPPPIKKKAEALLVVLKASESDDAVSDPS